MSLFFSDITKIISGYIWDLTEYNNNNKKETYDFMQGALNATTYIGNNIQFYTLFADLFVCW